MANRFSKNFTLTDIFNNKALKNKVPLINYKEKTLANGNVSRTTNGKTVSRLVFDTAKSGARPFYKPLEAHKQGDTISLGGTLVGEYDDAYNSIYNRLVGIKQLLSFTANNADMIRSALKEAEKNKRMSGNDSQLYLRVQSMEQIIAMTPKQLNGFINNVMENIMFSDNFPKTQAKYGVKEWNYDIYGATHIVNGNSTIFKSYRGRSYEQARKEWQRKVGIL